MGRYFYYCEDCHADFDEPDVIETDAGEYFGFPAYERIGVCPYCHSENYEEVYERDEDEEDDEDYEDYED